MILVIDNREARIIEFLQNKGEKDYVIETLVVGDIIFKNEEKT